MVINGVKLQWGGVKSGVPQGSVLGPILFLIYVSDISDDVSSNVILFADDTKLYSRVERQEDCHTLQEDLNKLVNWSEKWLMRFNTEKCKVLHGIYSLAARRLRGDLIETFKLLHGHTNIDYEIFFKLNNTTETRGHNCKLLKPQTTKGLQCRVNFLSIRVINAWNKLPCHGVSANSTNQFKSQLDHYWIKNGYGFSQA